MGKGVHIASNPLDCTDQAPTCVPSYPFIYLFIHREQRGIDGGASGHKGHGHYAVSWSKLVVAKPSWPSPIRIRRIVYT